MSGRYLALAVFLTGVLCADLDRVRAEPNLEKRSRVALENADGALKEARQAYENGDSKQTSALLSEVEASVELAETSLNGTGKNPRRSPKHFKHAELKTRELLRKIETFLLEMSVGDRPMLDAVKTKVQQVHDDMLHGVMGVSK